MRSRRLATRTLTPNQAKRQHVGWIEALAGRPIPELRDHVPAAPAPRAKPQRREAPVLKEVLHALKNHPAVAECWRNQAGQIAFNDGTKLRLGSKGRLDIAGRLKAGSRYFEIEVKAPGRKPEPHQEARILHVLGTGGLAGWCTSVEEAFAIIDAA